MIHANIDIAHGTNFLVVGNGGVGSPIAASLAAAGVGGMGLFDPHQPAGGGRLTK